MSLPAILKRRRGAPPTFPELATDELETGKVRRALELRFAEARAPRHCDLEQVRRAMREEFARTGRFDRLDRRLLRLSPWALFHRDGDSGPIAADDRFARAYVATMRDRLRATARINLLHAWLHDYPTRWPDEVYGVARSGLPNEDYWRRSIAALLEECFSPRCAVVRDIVRRYDLLGDDGAARVWGYLHQCGEEKDIDLCLAKIGLGGFLANSNFLGCVLGYAANTVGRRLAGEGEAAGLGAVLRSAVQQGPEGSRLRFGPGPHYRALADGLLRPLESAPEVGTTPKDLLKRFFLKYYGDPRLDPERWHGISEEAMEVMRRWLVEATLEDFLRLVQYVARGDEVASRHWRFRRAFWTTYLKKGAIDDAWMVLAAGLDEAARRRLRDADQAYGRLAPGPGVRRNHAVLILRIGRLVVTEWTHMGKWRAWREGTRGGKGDAPLLYQRRYRRDDLTGGAHWEGTHHWSEHGTWQRKLSDLINEVAGVRVSVRELMPRG